MPDHGPKNEVRRGVVMVDCQFTNNEIAVSVPKGTPLYGSGNVFDRNGKALEVPDRPSLEEVKNSLLGDPRLPDGTTWDELKEALRQIRSVPPTKQGQFAEKTSIGSKLLVAGKWSLEIASHLVAVADYCGRRGWL